MAPIGNLNPWDGGAAKPAWQDKPGLACAVSTFAKSYQQGPNKWSPEISIAQPLRADRETDFGAYISLDFGPKSSFWTFMELFWTPEALEKGVLCSVLYNI